MTNKDLIDNDFLNLLQVACRMAKMEVSKAGLITLLQLIDLVDEKGNQTNIRDVTDVELETIELIEQHKPIEEL